MAWVKLRPGAQTSAEEPGKVQKFKMRESAIEELKPEKAAAVQTA